MYHFVTIENVTDRRRRRQTDRQTDNMPWHRLDYGRPKICVDVSMSAVAALLVMFRKISI